MKSCSEARHPESQPWFVWTVPLRRGGPGLDLLSVVREGLALKGMASVTVRGKEPPAPSQGSLRPTQEA